MNIKTSHILAFFIIAGLTPAFFLIPALDSFKKSSNPFSLQKTEKKLKSQETGHFSGFETGTQISYRIAPNQGKTFAGEAQAIGNETLDVPFLLPESDQKSSAVAYDFKIRNSQKALDVLLRINRETGKFSISGKGADQFSKITIQGPSGRPIETKSDWAGLFEENGTSAPKDLINDSSFQIAFYNTNAMNDASHESPSIIKILTAPGGGGLGPGGVNSYSTTYCPLSVCDAGRMAAQIQNIVDNYVHALMLMTEQLSAIMLQQVQIIGSFFDAKMQLETQRELQTLTARAVKDYHPSEQMCRIGSYIKSLSTAEEQVGFNKMAINEALMTAYKNTGYASTSSGYFTDMTARLEQFRKVYCDPEDNNQGLANLCQHDPTNRHIDTSEKVGAVNKKRMNKDIDYTRTIEFPYTLDIDFQNGPKSDDEEDVLALARNLYWPKAFDPMPVEETSDLATEYTKMRHLVAMTNIAHNSYASIVGMKGKAPPPPPGTDPGWGFMKTLLREFGLSDADIEKLVGENPSYYAQMDVLTKKIYQNPNFYTNLYDKPANVDRIGVSLNAIKLMQSRDHFEAALRREMLLSTMVESELAKHHEAVFSAMEAVSSQDQKP